MLYDLSTPEAVARRANDAQGERVDSSIYGQGRNHGVKAWAHNHPLGMIAAFIAAAAGGSAASGYGLSGSGGSLGGGSGAPTGNDLGIFSNGGKRGMSQVGAGNMGSAVNSGSFTPMSSGGGMSQMHMPQQQQEQPKNTWLDDEMARQEKEREVKKQIAEQLGTRYV